ncbi:MAG: hypothetical protein IVW36_00795 [Dehalococcoidia bacterium]|nr:hypothetical protein [Dehalococcoidia bacterium]
MTTATPGRLFVALPRGFYPDGGAFQTTSGTAAGYVVFNAGGPGWVYGATGECWRAYYEVVGEGTVDYVADSPLPGAPRYVIHFAMTTNGKFNASQTAEAK